MYKIRLLILSLLFPVFIYGQVPVLIENIDTTVVTTGGYAVSLTSSILLTVRNSRFISTQTSGYVLYVGSDGTGAYNNNLDNATISGNYFKAEVGNIHGIMAGYNINYDVKYNYFDSVGYGCVVEGIDPMAYTSGGYTYNIFKTNSRAGIVVAGQDDVPIYNNTFYNSYSSTYYFMRILNGQSPPNDTTENIIVKNNVFYSTTLITFIDIDNVDLADITCDYNIYYVLAGDHNPRFRVEGVMKTWAEWQALGFDTHSQVIDPIFIDLNSLIPASPLEYGTDLGTDYDYGLTTSSEWVVGQYPDTVQQSATWQVGAYILTETPSPTAKYVATTGSDATGDGSLANPWQDPEYACQQLVAGDTLYIRGGTYYGHEDEITGAGTLDRFVLYINGDDAKWDQGTAGSPIVVMGYPGERAILDGSNITATSERTNIYLTNTEYWYFYDLETTNAQTTGSSSTRAIGWRFYYTEHCKAERCKAYRNEGYGFQLLNLLAGNPSKAQFINCDSYDNYDPGGGGNTSDGFSILGLAPADTTWITSCRAWYNSDDGFDWGWTNGVILADSCWAWINGRGGGSGNGFKMGHTRDSSVVAGRYYRVITHSFALYNKQRGFLANELPEGMIKFYNNVSYANGWGGTFEGLDMGGSGNVASIYRNNIIDLSSGEANWDVNLLTNSVHDHNSWTLSPYSTYTRSPDIWYRTNTTSSTQFAGVDSTGISDDRESGGWLPKSIVDGDFLHLLETSVYVNTGVDVGLTYNSTAPDMGVFEYTVTAPPTDPLVATTSEVSFVWTRKATGGGTVTYDGGGTISERGLCWKTSTDPTTADSKVTSGTGTGLYTATMTGLLPNTTYYVRAYAINETGTSYGSNVTFTTDKWNYVYHNGKIVTYNGKPVIVR